MATKVSKSNRKGPPETSSEIKPQETKVNSSDENTGPPKWRLWVLLGLLAVVAWFGGRRIWWQQDLLQAERMVAEHRDEVAMDRLEQLERRWGRSGETHFLRSRLLRRLGQSEEFQAELNKAAVKGYSPQLIRHEELLNQIQEGRLDVIPGNWPEFLSDTSAEFSENAMALIKGLMLAGDFEAVSALIDLWEKQEPNSFWIPFLKGRAAANIDNFKEATEYYQKAYAIRPDYTPLWSELGRNYWFQQEPDKAIEFFERVLSVDPENDEANSGLADAYLSTGEFEDAERILRRYLSPKDASSDTRMLLGRALIGQDRYQEAVDVMLPLIQLWPEDTEVNGLLATAYQALGDEENAEKYSLANQIGLTQTQKIPALRARFRRDPGNPELMYELGHLLMLYVTREEGRQLIVQSLGIYPDNIDAHRDMVRYCQAVGNQSIADYHQRQIDAIEKNRQPQVEN